MSADLERIIEIVFRAQDTTGQAFRTVASEMDRLGTEIEGAAKPFARMADTVIKIDAALAAMVVGGLALAIRESGKFGDGFNEIATLIDDSAGNIDAFKGLLKGYARDSAQSIEEIQAATYAAISAGVDYRQSLEMISVAEKLAIAGKADLKDTTILLASTLNAYGEATDQAGKYSDVFFRTVKEGQTTIPELAQGLASVTSIAAAAGIPIETVGAAIATLTAKGMPTSEAMTAIRGAISAIISPSKQAADYARELGIGFDAQALASKGLEGVLLDVYEATGGNVEQVSRLFGNIRGLTGVLAAFGQDGGDFFMSKLESMRGAAGSTTEAYDKMVKSLALANQTLANNVRITLADFGERIQDNYGEALGGLSEILKAVGKGVDAGVFDPVFKIINDFGIDINRILRGISESLPEAMDNIDWSGLLVAIGDLRQELGRMFVGIDLTTPEGLTKAIQAVIDTIESLVRITQGMVIYLKPVWEAIIEGVDSFNKLDEGSKTAAGEVLGAAKLIVMAGAEIGLALVAIEKAGLSMESAFRLIVGSIQVLIGGAKAAFSGLVVGLAEFLDKFFAYAEFLTNIPGLGGFKEGIQDVRRVLKETSEEWKEVLFDAADTSRDGLKKIGDAFTGAGSAARAAGEIIGKPLDIQIDAADVERARKALVEFGLSVEGLTDEQIIEFKAIMDQVSMVETVNKIAEVPKKITTEVKAEADEDSMKRVRDLVIEHLPDGSVNITQVRAQTDPTNLAETTKELDDAVPAEKKMQIQAQLDAERIKATAAIVQSSIEWTAKLNIAEVEANAKKVEAIMESVSVSVSTAGDVLGGIFGNIGALRDVFSSAGIDAMIRQQTAIQVKGLEMQEKMVGAEINLMNARTKSLERGEAMITIDGAGLQPHLESFMFEVLRAIQIRATAEGQKFLVGV